MLKEGLRAVTRRGEEAIWVHAGFGKAYRSVRTDVFDLLDTMLAKETEPWTLYITGHSLGGALSTLCAYECARRRSWPGPAPTVVNYSYGSPRVGNRLFAESFNAAVPNAWRVVNNNDAVTLVPRMVGYCHVGGKVQLSPGGSAEIVRESLLGVGEGADMGEMAAAVASQLAFGSSGEGADGAEVAAVIEAELAAMSALMDGSAVAEHLEPLYLENLRAFMEIQAAKKK